MVISCFSRAASLRAERMSRGLTRFRQALEKSSSLAAYCARTLACDGVNCPALTGSWGCLEPCVVRLVQPAAIAHDQPVSGCEIDMEAEAAVLDALIGVERGQSQSAQAEAPAAQHQRQPPWSPAPWRAQRRNPRTAAAATDPGRRTGRWKVCAPNVRVSVSPFLPVSKRTRTGTSALAEIRTSHPDSRLRIPAPARRRALGRSHALMHREFLRAGCSSAADNFG